MGKSTPAPTPPKETASAANSTNVGTAISNAMMGNVNQVTPDGTLNYDQTGTYKWSDPYTGQSYDIPRFTATQTLSPEQQAIKSQTDAAEANMAGIANSQSSFLKDYLGRPLDTSGIPQAGNYGNVNTGGIASTIGDAGAITRSYGTDFSKDRQRVEDALMARMQPQLRKDQNALDTKLANRGIGLGSRAASAAYDDLGRSQNDARMAAILAAGDEQSRLAGLEAQRAQFQNSAQQQQFDQNSSRATFGNSAQQQGFQQQMAVEQSRDAQRNQALQETFATRNQPINEITALLSGSQVSQPNFVNANMPTIPTTDTAGIISNYDNQRIQAANANNAATSKILGGLFGLGSSFLGNPALKFR